jgi:superkiller protein 3
LIQVNDFDGAINEYQRAIKLNPDNQWTSVFCQALASIYYQVKQSPDAAIATYQTAIMLDDTNADTYLSLGNVYHDIEDLDSAIDCYCESIKNDPFVPKAYCNLGLALWEKDYVEEAIVAYNKAIILDEEYSIAHNNLGVAYLDGNGEAQKAVVCLKKR